MSRPFLPSADDFARYRDIHPEAPKVILLEFRRQMEHFREMDLRRSEAERRSEVLGLWLGFSIGIAGIAGATFMVATGHEVAGTVVGSVNVCSLMSILVVGRYRSLRSRARRDDEQPRVSYVAAGVRRTDRVG